MSLTLGIFLIYSKDCQQRCQLSSQNKKNQSSYEFTRAKEFMVTDLLTRMICRNIERQLLIQSKSNSLDSIQPNTSKKMQKSIYYSVSSQAVQLIKYMTLFQTLNLLTKFSQKLRRNTTIITQPWVQFPSRML